MVKSGGGSIIDISSSAGAYLTNVAGHVTSKGDVALMTCRMTIDHTEDGMRLNCVAPGPTGTPALQGVPREQTQVALFPVFDRALFVTGSALATDGGQMVKVQGRG